VKNSDDAVAIQYLFSNIQALHNVSFCSF